jgi:hypothetical protein
VDPAHVPQHEDETLMSWESGGPATAVPGYFRHGQEIIPLTVSQRETLIKWWGRDRLTEQPHSLCGRSSPDEDRPLSFDGQDTSGGEASLGRKNSLVNKVKGAHISPPFRKGLWRSGSSRKQRR